MLKMPYIHYIDVKSNEQRQQESLYWHHYKSAGHPCSLACLIMICSLLDVTHKEHKWQNGFFHLSWKATSICTEDVKHADNVQQYFWRESNMGLLFTMSWSGRLFFLFLFTTLTGVVASGMKWRRLREFPSLTQAFITSSSLYKWHNCRQNLPRRGFLQKPFVKELAEKEWLLHKSCDLPLHPRRGFCLRVQVAGFS
jgi:hypothetical protein